jgi:hypothetical protein
MRLDAAHRRVFGRVARAGSGRNAGISADQRHPRACSAPNAAPFSVLTGNQMFTFGVSITPE